MNIIIDRGNGKFGVSKEALDLLRAKGHYDSKKWGWTSVYPDEVRTLPLFITVVQELGQVASRRGSRLIVITIPDDVKWEIVQTPQGEEVHERHRVWTE